MKKIFTLLTCCSVAFIAQAQVLPDSAFLPTDSLKTASMAALGDSITKASLPVLPDTARTAPAVVQNETVKPANVPTSLVPATVSEVFRKNIVKMNVSSLMFSNYNFSYERALSRKFTFTAGYRFMPKKALSDVPVFSKAIDLAGESVESGDFDIQAEMKNFMMSNSAYTGEFRYYPSKRPGARGFYVSLYGRYTDMRFNYAYEYEIEDQKQIMPVKSTFKGYGGGIMFGTQWLIAKRVTLDWHIIGAHYGKMSGTANGAADLTELPEEDRRDMEEDIESFLEFGDKKYLQATITDNGIDAKVDSPFAGIRSGISIGIAF